MPLLDRIFSPEGIIKLGWFSILLALIRFFSKNQFTSLQLSRINLASSSGDYPLNQKQSELMKSILTTLLGSLFFAGFALAGDCDKCKKKECDKEEAIIAGCDKCKKDDSDKEEAIIAGDCDKCKKKDCDKEEAVIAGCDKCKKDDSDKEEAVIAGCDKCKKDDSDKEEAVIA
ncbi:MAG: hypothetical protein Q7Q71_07190 [Verrucomicrobiota bacterium JB023]|nr:hypothetical protein [Verrucomicrobiota bacterium JB023]